MSDSVFPVLDGLAWDIKLTPQFSTKALRSVGGKELRTAFMAYPLWTIAMTFTVLRDNAVDNELKTMAGFFLARQGSFDSFKYLHPDDNAVTNEYFGTGNASAVAFQLMRGFGGFREPVSCVSSAAIMIDGITKATPGDYSINSKGIVTFVTPPANGAVLTWTGGYHWRVRFADDRMEFNQFMKNLWELKKLELTGAVSDKI